MERGGERQRPKEKHNEREMRERKKKYISD